MTTSFFGMGFAAGDADAQNLFEAMAEAYRTNPTLEADRASVRATDETVSQARAGWRPDVRIVSEVGKLRRRTNNIGGGFGAGNDTRTTANGALRVTQNVYAGGGTEAEIRLRRNEVSAARARLVSSQQQVLLDVVTAYMNVVRDEAVLRLSINNEQVLQRQFDAARDRFNVGEVTRTDVAQAESRRAQATANRIQAEGDLQVSRAFYLQIVGSKPGSLARPEFPPNLPATEEEAVALARENNPNVIAVAFDERAAADFVDFEQAALYPNVDLVGVASRSRNEGSDDRTINDVTVGAELTIPLYQQGLVYSRVREAKQLRSQAFSRIEETKRAAAAAAESSWEVFLTARASIESRAAEVRAARIALDGVQQEAEVGSRTTLDVLDAEQELLDAQVNLVRDERDSIVAAYDLLSSIGRLTARDLELPVDHYDPDRHYERVNTKWWGTGIEGPVPPATSK